MQRITAGYLSVVGIVIGSFISFAGEAATPRTYRGVVTKISDGDTFRFLPEGMTSVGDSWAIRMMTIDTAELHLPAKGGVMSQGYWGREGQAELESMISAGDAVEVVSYGRDTYGRVLGKVHRGAQDVNLEMVRSGWAALYVICDEASCDMDPAYQDACRDAVSNGRGLFDPENPLRELPFLFRSRVQERPLAKFVADVSSGKYYAPKDYDRVDVCDRVFFLNEADAIAKGFEPAI